MGEVAFFDDAELWATGYMRAALAARSEPYASGVKVGTVVPNPRPPRLVQFRRDGGPQVSPVHEAVRFGVNVWAASEKDANDLAALTRALLSAAEGSIANGRQVKSITTTGPSSIAEADGVHKYLTAEVMVRGSALT